MARVRYTSWAAALSTLLLSVACGPAAPPQAAPAEPPAAVNDCLGPSAVDVLHHQIDLDLSLSPPALAGSAELTLRARRDTTHIALDARRLLIRAVSTPHGPARFERTADRLCAELPLRAGEELRLHLDYQVEPGSETPAFAPDQVWAGYAASAWMPTLQDPAQRATLALHLRVPAGVRVAGSGRALPIEPLADGRALHAFLLERPSPPFLFAFAAGRFDEASLEVDGVRLVALGPPGADLASALNVTAPMLRFLVEHTGASFPAPTYVQAFVHGDAMQEAAGLSLLGDETLTDLAKDPTEDWLIAHELAHQWFAWLIPCADFADFWLNEGFATFLVAAVKEQRWGRAAYDREVALWRARSAKAHAEGKDAPVSLSSPSLPQRPPPTEATLQARGVTYSRGALVLHRLRSELGDALFWEGIRRYVRARAEKGARSEDLRAALEAATGRDLRAWFERWVYTSAPDL